MPASALSSAAASRQSQWTTCVVGRAAPMREGGRTRRQTARPSSSSRRSRRPPMYPVAPVRRTFAAMAATLLVLRQDNGIDHVDDAVAGGNIGLDDASVVDRDAAVRRSNGQRVAADRLGRL